MDHDRESIGPVEEQGRPGPGQRPSGSDAAGTRGSELEKLRERARKLAHPLRDERTGEGMVMVVEFMLAGERYVLDARYVHEVVPLKEVVPLPGAPDFVLGITNLRGEICSVVDLRKIFNLPEDHGDIRRYAVILRNEDMEFGLYADSAPEVRLLPLDSLQESLPTLTDVRAEFLKGVTDEGVVYLDAVRLLSDERITTVNQ